MDVSKYAELFLTESREHLSAINHALLELERTGGSADAVAAIFRAVHTVKGMSATMGYTAVAELSHELESLLDAVRRGDRSVTPAMMDALFHSADVLEHAVEASVANRLEEIDIAPAIEQLRALGADDESAESAAQSPESDHGPGTTKKRRRKSGERAASAPSPAGNGAAEAIPANGAPTAAPSVPTPSGTRRQRHVRIDLRRLDNLMNLIGELVITRGRLAQLAAASGDPALDDTVNQASRLITDLQDEIMTCRMVPVWQVFDRFPRLVRDAGRALGKPIELTIEGKEIEIDRSMLDEVGDPIVHLLRNAVDHGIETPAERKTAGKPEAGRLVLSAVRDRSTVLIRVSDDGRGIDRAKVLRRAREMGLVEAGRTELSDEELFRLISRSGFSTADKVTDISGRGVGMDTVQSKVRALGGALEIRTAPGEGTTVTARLPVTLAIVRALLARVASETYALPLTHINETVLFDPGALRTIKGQEVLMLRDDVLPVIRLRERMRLPAHTAGDQQVIVLDVASRRAGLVVDELAGQQEIVVKQFDGVRDGLSLFSGATILGDGVPALIVDVGSLV